MYIANCNDQSQKMKSVRCVYNTLYSITAYLSYIFLSKSKSDNYHEQQMAMTCKRLKVPFSLIKNTNQSRF